MDLGEKEVTSIVVCPQPQRRAVALIWWSHIHYSSRYYTCRVEGVVDAALKAHPTSRAAKIYIQSVRAMQRY